MVGAIAEPLFQSYLLAFEITRVLLLAAVVGAVRPREEGALMLLGPALALSAVLFTIGVVGVLTRRNAIIIFMCVELMLNAVNLHLRRASRRCTASAGRSSSSS